jgi:HK97 gp10 family phage protein
MAARSRIRVKVQGAPEVEAALQKLGPQIARRATTPALRAGGAVLRREIRAKAPDGPDKPHPKYGQLKDNIRVTLQRRANGMLVAVVHTGRAFWARFIEYGTVARRARGFKDGERKSMANRATGEFFGKEVGPMPRRPFFRPAFDGKAGEALAAIQARMKAEVENVGRLVAARGRRRR